MVTAWRIGTAVAVALAFGACASGGGSGQGGARELVYVASQADASVSVLDASDGTVVATVDFQTMGFDANARPHSVAVEPDGSHWYVSLIGANRVLKFDARNRLVDEAPFEAAGMLALDAASDRLYVGRSMAAVNPPSRIGMIDRSTMAIDEVDVFFPRPHALVVEPRGGRVYSASLAENRIASAPVGSEDVDLTDVEGSMHMIVQFAVSPDGRWMVGGGQMSGDLLVWDVTADVPRAVTVVHVGGQPWHPSFTPGGSQVWLPNLTNNEVTVIDADGWRIVGEVTHPALVEPHGSAVSADGRTVFLSARNSTGAYGTGAPGTVVAIDVATLTVRWVAEVGRYAAGIAVRTPAATRRR